MSVRSTSPIMSQSDVQVIPMEEQRQQRRQSWNQPAQGQDPFRSGYDVSLETPGT